MEDGEQRQFRLPTSAHTLYEAYCDIRLAPVSASPFDDDDDSEGSAQQPAAAGDDGDAGDTGDEQQPVAGALCGPVPLAEINPIETATPLSQKEFFEETLLEIMHGDRPPYTEWNRLEVTPPDPLCGTCKTPDAYALKPIRFWSHEMWSIATPCANHGWAHAEHVTRGRWHMRRVKCVFDDWYLAGRETVCSKCQEEKESLKKKAKTVKAALGNSQDTVLSLQLQILQALI